MLACCGMCYVHIAFELSVSYVDILDGYVDFICTYLWK